MHNFSKQDSCDLLSGYVFEYGKNKSVFERYSLLLILCSTQVHVIEQTYLNGMKCQIQALMTCLIDDSIYLQAKVGREKECEAALQRLRGENADISWESAEIRVTSSLHTSMRE